MQGNQYGNFKLKSRIAAGDLQFLFDIDMQQNSKTTNFTKQCKVQNVLSFWFLEFIEEKCTVINFAAV